MHVGMEVRTRNIIPNATSSWILKLGDFDGWLRCWARFQRDELLHGPTSDRCLFSVTRAGPMSPSALLRSDGTIYGTVYGDTRDRQISFAVCPRLHYVTAFLARRKKRCDLELRSFQATKSLLYHAHPFMTKGAVTYKLPLATTQLRNAMQILHSLTVR